MSRAVIAGYARTPFHFARKGKLAAVRPDDLAAIALRGLVTRLGLEPELPVPGGRVLRQPVRGQHARQLLLGQEHGRRRLEAGVRTASDGWTCAVLKDVTGRDAFIQQ